mmetsp:Transcript_47177/g.112273  ORF Transcript_47177/g.112273 Transcript_47177/m.112273 type:complete len:1099 (-) Transcript_47177:162-3458(-)
MNALDRNGQRRIHPALTSGGAGALQEFPLKITIPRTEKTRIALSPVPYHVYIICIDDCGKAEEGATPRRFSDFVRLHTALRELDCPLPELPAKKVFGNLKEDFVTQRRQRLQDYLNALLHQPSVVVDNTFWQFLDIRRATAVVPRLLCKPISISDCERIFGDLVHELVTKPIGDQDRLRMRAVSPARVEQRQRSFAEPHPELFRLCNPVAMQALATFATEEAGQATTVTPAQVSAKQDLLARMKCRHHFMKVLEPLITRSSAWPHMQEACMFNALLALLRRVTSDSAASQDNTIRKDCMHLSEILMKCLVKMIEASRGKALLHFFEKQDGMVLLSDACGSETDGPPMHKAVALILWHGLAVDEVVETYMEQPEKGLTLLDILFTSDDLQANILSALCFSRILRHPAASIIGDRLREKLFTILGHIPGYLDNAEAEACTAAAAQRSSASGGSAGSAAIRDAGLSALLKSLCTGQELERIHSLLYDSEQAPDAITELVVSLLYHFTQHFISEPEVLRSLANDATKRSLQCLLVLDYEPALAQVRHRAAFVLTHLDDIRPEASPQGEPQSLASSEMRAYTFQVLHEHAQHIHSSIAACAKGSEGRAEQDDATLHGYRLAEVPCMDEASLEEFIRKLRALQARRNALQQSMVKSKEALSKLQAGLDRHQSADCILSAELRKLQEEIRSHSVQEERCTQMSQSLADAEASFKDAVSARELAQQEEERCALSQKELQDNLQRAEDRTAKLASEEEDLLRIRTSAPAECWKIQEHVTSLESRMEGMAAQKEELQSIRQDHKHRSEGLENHIKYAEEAVHKIGNVVEKLRKFRESLTSETVMSLEAKEELHQYELALPRRPDAAAEIEEDDSTATEDVQADQEFNAAPNFRSLLHLCDARAESWKQRKNHLAGLKRSSTDEQTSAAQQLQKLSEEEQSMKQELEKLLVQHETLSDHDGHTWRHQEACDAHNASKAECHTIASQKADIDWSLEQHKAALRAAQAREEEELAKFSTAKEDYGKEVALQNRLRSEVQARLNDLWGREKEQMTSLSLLSLDQHHLEHCLQQVKSSFSDEADARAAVQTQANVIRKCLNELDMQLDAPCDR